MSINDHAYLLHVPLSPSVPLLPSIAHSTFSWSPFPVSSLLLFFQYTFLFSLALLLLNLYPWYASDGKQSLYYLLSILHPSSLPV